MIYDIVILGSGPAGLTAGIYSSRAQKKTLILEGNLSGGQLMTTTTVENWPGYISIQGPDLMEKMREHAKYYGCELRQETASSVDFSKKIKVVTTEGGTSIEAKSVIITTGAKSKMLNCPGEEEYFAKGVSTCATCDAPFYKNKEVVIVGGGDSAVTEASHLLHFVKKLTIIQIEKKLSANDPIKFKVLENPNTSFIYNSTVKEIKGNGDNVTEIVVENVLDKRTMTIPTNGVFLAIGYSPNTDIFKGKVEIDEYGYVLVEDHTKTSVDGIFAAGDAVDYIYRQAITSAGAGCMASLDAQAYLAG
jgi:thioredoxin reductase (NADPH)